MGGQTILYIHDINDHIIAELNASGQTQREYLWLDDLPVAVVDGVSTGSPQLYFVVTDHLGRPAKMISTTGVLAWDVIYAPFGAVSSHEREPRDDGHPLPGSGSTRDGAGVELAPAL